MNAEILACEVEGSSVNVERGADPIILLHFMCQQIHCVRKKNIKDGDKKEKSGDKKNTDTVEEEDTSGRTYMEEELGDIVEGSEDDIRANSYVVAFQREYNEEKMELNWKIVDFRFNGAIAYL
jgi:import inner membrane translocase subunit TIM44